MREIYDISRIRATNLNSHIFIWKTRHKNKYIICSYSFEITDTLRAARFFFITCCKRIFFDKTNACHTAGTSREYQEKDAFPNRFRFLEMRTLHACSLVCADLTQLVTFDGHIISAVFYHLWKLTGKRKLFITLFFLQHTFKIV